ncbi:MAG: hypothetical protein JRH11_18115 [Deltaproteobacteria bacterium]|nr:hypothetical protein [Deltaproteobacteria bacterium]
MAHLGKSSSVFLVLLPLCCACSLSHGPSPRAEPRGPGLDDEAAPVPPLEDPQCSEGARGVFEDTGHGDVAVALAAEFDLSQTCGCGASPLFAQPANVPEWDSLDCLCESYRTCTETHARAVFFAAASNVLFDYFVTRDSTGGCSVEVLSGSYDAWMNEGDPMRERCASLSCVVDDRGNLRGSLEGCAEP